jgi:hypothetical protein
VICVEPRATIAVELLTQHSGRVITFVALAPLQLGQAIRLPQDRRAPWPSRGRQAGADFCEVLLRARTKGRAKSWTLHSVADAKWSTTGNFQVASCLWTSSCFVDDILDLGSTFNTFKKFSRKSQRITEHISGRRRMCHLRHPVAARYLKKGAGVVSLTGKHWTEANIGNALAGRELRRSRLRSAVNRARSSDSTGATPVIGGCGR